MTEPHRTGTARLLLFISIAALLVVVALVATRQPGAAAASSGADISEQVDAIVARMARKDAFGMALEDPGLAQPEHARIRERLDATFEGRLDLIQVG
jgi:hypothetical protein